MTTSQKISAVVYVGAVVALMFWARSCGIKSVMKATGSDTVVIRDTVKIPEYVPEIIGVTNTIYVKGKPYAVHDTLNTLEVRIDPADTAAILADYNATRLYSDTQRLNRGTVIIDDAVSRNRITGRKLTVTGTDTTITNTITLKQPKRFVGYFTASVAGNLQTPLAGAGGGFALKLPNELIFGAEWKLLRNNRPMGELRLMLPIRLKKNY